jgi:hypothetical protein
MNSFKTNDFVWIQYYGSYALVKEVEMYKAWSAQKIKVRTCRYKCILLPIRSSLSAHFEQGSAVANSCILIARDYNE